MPSPPSPPLPWFKVWRKIFDSRVWNHPVDHSVFIWLVGHADMNGEIMTSDREIQRGCHYLTREQVRKSLPRMERYGEVKTRRTHKGTHKRTHITICNWERYQGFGPTKEPTKEPTIPYSKVPVRRGLEVREEKNPPTPRKRGTPPTPIPESLQTEEFAILWSEWVTHRTEIKKPATPTAQRRTLVKLERWGPARAVAALEHSIANGWQGVFEPDAQGGNGKNPPKADWSNYE